MTTEIKPRQPIAYSGEGSAVDSYQRQQLNTAPKSTQIQSTANWGLFDKNNQQHKYLMSLLYQAQWTKDWNGRNVPDTMRLSDFLKSEKSPVNKALKKMQPEEVSKIIVAFGGIVESKFK